MPSGPDSDVPFGAYYHHLKYLQTMGPAVAGGLRPGHRDPLRRFTDQGRLLARDSLRAGLGDRERPVDGRPVDRELQRQGRLHRAHARSRSAGSPTCASSNRARPARSCTGATARWPPTASTRRSIRRPAGPTGSTSITISIRTRSACGKVVLRTRGHFLWPEEVIGLCHPGQRPEDVVELSALKLVNLKGQSHTYTWAEKGPKIRPSKEHKDYIDFGGKPEDPEDTSYEDADEDQPVIVMVNTKSKHRPFQVVEPDSWMAIFGIEHRPGVSHFPWWNHWPVSQLPSDGRYCQAPDRAAHFSLAWASPLEHQGEDRTFWWAWMYGMTDQPAESRVPLAASWLHAPKLTRRRQGIHRRGLQLPGALLSPRQRRSRQHRADHAEVRRQRQLTGPQHPAGHRKLPRRRRAGQGQRRSPQRGEDYRLGRRTRLDQPGTVLFIETQATSRSRWRSLAGKGKRAPREFLGQDHDLPLRRLGTDAAPRTGCAPHFKFHATLPSASGLGSGPLHHPAPRSSHPTSS